MSKTDSSKNQLHLIEEDLGMALTSRPHLFGLALLLAKVNPPCFDAPDWIESARTVESVEEYLSAWAAFGEHCSD